MAEACKELGIDECQLSYLRLALDANPKDIAANRQAALTLQRMGQFDQAIACWHRVEQAKPHDEEALQAISRLSVEKTIHEGGYDSSVLIKGNSGNSTSKISVAQYSRDAKRDDSPVADEDVDLPPEERFKQAIARDPNDLQSSLKLADLYLHQNRYDEAERILERALQASGGGDLNGARASGRSAHATLATAAGHCRTELPTGSHGRKSKARRADACPGQPGRARNLRS